MKTGKLQIWVPELIAREGGIQSYSIEMVEAAAEILGPGRVTVLSKSDDPAALELWAAGRVASRSTGQVGSPARTPSFAGMLLREGLASDPDLIISTHANFSPVARTLFRMRRIPAAIAAHGIEVWDLAAGRTRNSLMAADTILPVSDYTKSRLMHELKMPEDRFQVIPDTFDPVRFSPGPAPAGLRERYGLKPSDQVLLCVSRLDAMEKYKGYHQIISVLPSLLKKIPNLKFMMVGRGSDRTNVEALVAKLGLQEKVILAGFVPSQELADHYRMADAFAMPSKKEGFGIVYLEAMGCGKKCLGGSKDAAVDALRHGELGILVDPDNLRELEEGLFRLITEPKPSAKEIHEKADGYFGRASFKTKVKALLESFGLR